MTATEIKRTGYFFKNAVQIDRLMFAPCMP